MFDQEVVHLFHSMLQNVKKARLVIVLLIASIADLHVYNFHLLKLIPVLTLPPSLSVVSVSEKPHSKHPPLALHTVELLRSCSIRLHMGPKQAMDIAERLYTEVACA